MTLDKYIKFTLKNKIIATLVGFALIIFCLIFFIVIPTMQDIKTMGGAIEEQMIDLEKRYIRGNSLRQLTEDLKKIEPKLDQLDQIFINKNRELEFITTLENEANNSRVAQKINLSSPASAEKQEFQKNSLQLLAQGDFNRLLKYLTDLESLSYYINIKLLEITPATGGGKTATNNQDAAITGSGTGNLNMLIDADTYWK
jgi:Tfp pilus assembly protein PilO